VRTIYSVIGKNQVRNHFFSEIFLNIGQIHLY